MRALLPVLRGRPDRHAAATPSLLRPMATAGWRISAPLALGFLTLVASGHAQDVVTAAGARFVHERWTAASGLPVDQLTGAVQSRDGYLWFSTFDGLVRFDGARFTVFNAGNSPDLPTNRLTAIVEDGRDRLWIQTEQGHLLERRDGRFVDHTPNLGGGPVLTLHAHADAIWAGTAAGVFRFADSAFVAVHAGAFSEPVLALLVDSRDALWIGTARGGLFRAGDRGRGPVVAVPGIGDEHVHRLAEDPAGAVWVAGESRSFRIPPVDADRADAAAPGAGATGPGPGAAGQGPGLSRRAYGAPEPFPPQPPAMGFPLAFHFPAGGGPAWVQAWSGPWALVDGRWVPADRGGTGRLDPVLGVVGPDGGLWAVGGRRVYRDGEALFDATGRVERILFDLEGTVWITGHGLHKLRPAPIEQRGSGQGFADNVYAVHEDRRGRIWIGSLGGGLLRLEEDGRVRRYPTSRGSGLANVVLPIHEDRLGHVWVGLGDGGVCRLEGDGCAPDGIERLGGRLVRAMHEDRTGALWLGTVDGLFHRDPGGGLRRFGPDDGLPHPDVRAIAEDRSGRLWLGTYGGGLARWDGERFALLGIADGLSSPVIRALYLDREDVLWVGTEGRGLNRVVPLGAGAERGRGRMRDDRASDSAGAQVQGHVTVYRTADGLFDDGQHSIVEDDFGRLWMSTNRGIFWVAREELTAFAEGRAALVHATSYTERDGLLNREMNGGVQGAGIRDRRGRLWFGGIGGVAMIDPAAIQRNERPPPVAIESVVAGSETPPLRDGRVRLAARQRDFEIAYTALSFVAPENVRFRYRLVGFNDRWVEAGGRRTAYYTNVPPGEYTFRVAASNNDGVWNDDGASIDLVVAPFLYETWPARGGFALLLALLAFVMFRYRERQHGWRAAELEALVRARTRTIERQTEQLRALDEAKSRFFANVSHELRTPLTLTIGPLEDVRERRLPPGVAEDVDLALKSSRRLLRLVNQILDVAKLEAGQMELRAARSDPNALLARLVDAFAPLAERRRIMLRLEPAVPPPEVWFDPDLMEKVFTNLLSNALKFTPEGGAVRVTVDAVTGRGYNEAGEVRVRVKDSGPGIPASEMPHLFERFRRGADAVSRAVPGTGIGLSLAKELVELHGGSIACESEEGFGSMFTVTLPLGRDHLPEAADTWEEGLRGSIADDRPASEAGAVPADHRAAGEGAAEDTGDRAADEVAAAAADEGGETPEPGQDRRLVLIVDDDADVRAFVRRHLAPTYRTAEAADGEEALDRAREEVPDLIVSDVLMPRMDGIELLRAMRVDPELDFVPVVLLTARAEVEDRIRGFETGADDYLVKPFQAAELRARVENLVRSRERLRERTPPAALRPSEVDVVSSDDRFLARLRDAIEANMADEDFDVEALARAMAQSRSSLYRRLGDLGVGSPADVIRALRLDRAAQLLAGRAGSVSEVAYGVGFKSVSHFSRAFRERFAVTPSAFRAGAVPDGAAARSPAHP